MQTFKTYPNGIRFIHEYMPTSESINISISVVAGGADENVNQHGIAHFLEHMFFKSTTTRNFNEILTHLDTLGGAYNAYTSKEVTCFHISTLKSNLEKAVDSWTDSLLNAKIDSDELNTEKNTICSEIDRSRDSHMRMCGIALGNNCYAGTRFGHDLLGTKKDVKGYTSEDLWEFRNAHYTPGNIIISTAGGVEFDRVEKAFQSFISAFGGEATPHSLKLAQKQINPKSPFVFTKKEDTDQFYCDIAYEGFNASSERLPAAEIVSIILGGGLSSRLFKKVRSEKGLVYGISAYNDDLSEYAVGGIMYSTNFKDAKESLETIRECLKEVIKDGFTKEELSKAKSIVKTRLALDYEQTADVAALNRNEILYRERQFDIERTLGEYDAVTLEDINRLARDILKFDKMIVSALAKSNDINPLEILNE